MSGKRNIYLKMKSLEQAREILLNTFTSQSKVETIATVDSAGRVLAGPAFASVSSPNFHSAAMDGVAVKAGITFNATEAEPKKLKIGTDGYYINTGRVMPENCDAVIMIENVNDAGDGCIEIEAPVFPWQHVRKMGEDIVATELLFARNHKITPYCIGALLTGGVFRVDVKIKPKVLIIPTGGELKSWNQAEENGLEPGDVIESNAWVLGGLVQELGGEFNRIETIVDDQKKIEDAVQKAVDGVYDIVCILGGSSAGSEDFSRAVLESLGQVHVHGVTIMPGKPTVIGSVADKPVFGIPGYPVSAIIAFEQFVAPVIARMLKQPEKTRQRMEVLPARKIPSKLGTEEFLRVKLGKAGENVIAAQLPRGAGCITSITEADGIIRIPRDSEGIAGDEKAVVELLKPAASIDNTIVVVGSHDNTLDILADQLRTVPQGYELSSSHVGSMGGLMALKRGTCHIAGSHLLDAEDGSYNISYIKRYLPDIPVVLVNLVMRDQGLILPRGNPKSIQAIEDLARDDVRIINRQGGSGTRILLDYKLKQAGINPDSIAGYQDEEFTHMSVAAAVLGNRADAGLGIFAAAKALDLDFIPIVTEEYDLVIPKKHFDSKKIKTLIYIIKSDGFKGRVNDLGGYNTISTGKIVWE